MDKLSAIMAYFCSEYPYKQELSKARLTKLIYLSDWFSALLNDNQLTNIDWVFNHYGPYVEDVYNTAIQHNDFSIIPQRTVYGGEKYVISYSGPDVTSQFSPREKAILDAIIDKTKSMFFNDFIDYVYSTYPVKANERYSNLNLVELAREFKSTVDK